MHNAEVKFAEELRALKDQQKPHSIIIVKFYMSWNESTMIDSNEFPSTTRISFLREYVSTFRELQGTPFRLYTNYQSLEDHTALNMYFDGTTIMSIKIDTCGLLAMPRTQIIRRAESILHKITSDIRRNDIYSILPDIKEILQQEILQQTTRLIVPTHCGDLADCLVYMLSKRSSITESELKGYKFVNCCNDVRKILVDLIPAYRNVPAYRLDPETEFVEDLFYHNYNIRLTENTDLNTWIRASAR